MELWMLSSAIALIGVVGQWAVAARANARRDGAIDQQLKSHESRLEKHGEEIDGLRGIASEHGAKIAALDARANAAAHHRG